MERKIHSWRGLELPYWTNGKLHIDGLNENMKTAAVLITVLSFGVGMMLGAIIF